MRDFFHRYPLPFRRNCRFNSTLCALLLFVFVPRAAAADTSAEPGETLPPFTLQDCIDYAFLHSPTLAKQSVAVKSQKLQTVIEEARFAFTLAARDSHAFQAGVNSSEISLNKEFKSGFSLRGWVNAERENGRGFTDSSAAVQLSKQLLGGGTALESSYDLKASMLDELSALNNLNQTRRRLALDLRLAYYNIIQAQQSLMVKQRALANAERNLMLTRERENPLDILTAEIRVPENEQAVNSAQRNIDNGLDTLKERMGFPVRDKLTITGEFSFELHEVVLADDLLYAFDNLESMLNNRLENRKLHWLLDIRDSQRLPTLNLAATHRQYGDGDGFNFDGNDEQSLTLNLSWEIGRRTDAARWELVRNRIANNQHDYVILSQEISTNLSSYHRRLQEGARAVTLQEDLCKLLQRKEELYRDRWENGEIDILELVRTQTDLENSYVDLINRKIEYLQLVGYYEFTAGR
jgi:outer membrane protein TolC